jgi:cytidylate kinase
MSYYQIALDGPAGAGKSTIAKELSKRLGFTFINSGGMYRCIAIALLRNNTDISNIEEVTKVLNTIDVTQNGNDLLLNGEVVTNICYTPEITRFVPTISPIPQVREACHEFQMRLANSNNIVAEGRDTTTVVFPNATLKVFVTADQLLRVLRR